MVKAIFARDYVLLQGAVLVFALAFVVINLLVDLSYGLLDPRVARQADTCAEAGRSASVATGWRCGGPGRSSLCSALKAALAPWLAPYDPARQSLIEKRAMPGGKYLLGADEFGRDILSRVIYGTRIALLVGGLGRDRACSAASCWARWRLRGRLARRRDHARRSRSCSRSPTCCSPSPSWPPSGPGVVNTTLAVGIWGIARGDAHRARLGAGAAGDGVRRGRPRPRRARRAPCSRRTSCRTSSPALIVYATLFMANAILLEAALSFLGLGVQPPTASWGLMVSTGRDVLLVAPHVATVPGIAIMVAVLAFNLVGDGLRDALDPRLRGA